MVNQKKVIKPRSPPGIKYKHISKTSISELIKKTVPKELIPTKKTGYVLGVIFLIVIIYGLISFPFGKMLSGTVEGLEIKIGVPFAFLVFDLMNPENTPIKINGLLLDLIIYLILSYAVDVAINLTLNSPIFESEEEKKKRPKLFRDIKGEKIKNEMAKNYVSEINEKKEKQKSVEEITIPQKEKPKEEIKTASKKVKQENIIPLTKKASPQEENVLKTTSTQEYKIPQFKEVNVNIPTRNTNNPKTESKELKPLKNSKSPKTTFVKEGEWYKQKDV